MDRVFDHLRYVRCPTCSRVFCCTKHRVQHERRVHVAVPGGPVIRRRFRSSQVPQQQPGKQMTAHPGGHSPANSRKRSRVDIAPTAAQSISSGLRIVEQRHHRRVEELRRTEETRTTENRRRTDEQRWAMERRAVMIEACARNILRARRSSLATVRHLRPVAESSPAVPVPPPCTPRATSTGAAETAATPVEWSVVVSSVGSPPSFYQTPMQTPTQEFPDTPSLQELPDTPLQMLPGTPLQTLSDTPVNGKPPCSGGSVKRVSLGDGSTQKGFFWSNMARRFRLALRPAKPKVVENSNCPSPSASANVDCMVNPYGNIQPRRPICNNDTLMTPVHPRPSLEAIRKAHEEASKAFNRFMTD